jgi:O-antigen/teichoic acid export membrane protein
MSVKRNVVANYLGQGWAALMGLAFIPLYIRYLGMEAYGLIGVFAVLQACLALLDIGMAPTLNREMARFTANAHSAQSIRDLLRSLEIICFGLAAFIAVVVWGASGYLATSWLKVQELPIEVVSRAIAIMAFVIALRFCEGIYRSSMFGLQRQVWYNAAYAILATIRYGGAVAILALVSPTIEAFFIWQAAISALTVVVFALRVHQALPRAPSRATFSLDALAGVWRFASGMMGITVLALLLTQVDKVLLSRLLPLDTFGYYALAATVAGILYLIVGPLTQAVYPRMVELSVRDDQGGLISVYHQGAQLVTILTAPAVVLFGFFAGGVVFMWSGSVELAENVAPILSVLVVGTFLNALMSMPYQYQLAHGWTGLTLKINLLAVAILVPAIFWVVPRYGALGAAWVWVALNTGYVMIAVQIMHRRLIPHEKWKWYISDVLLPVLGAVSVMSVALLLQPARYQDRWNWMVFSLITITLALAASAALASRIRPRVLAIIRRSGHGQPSAHGAS